MDTSDEIEPNVNLGYFVECGPGHLATPERQRVPTAGRSDDPNFTSKPVTPNKRLKNTQTRSFLKRNRPRQKCMKWKVRPLVLLKWMKIIK